MNAAARKTSRSAMSLYAKDRHKRAARMIGCALVADDPAIWRQTSEILAHRLTRPEVVALANATLQALEPQAREMVLYAATFDDDPRDPAPRGWNLEAIVEYRAARDRRAARS